MKLFEIPKELGETLFEGEQGNLCVGSLSLEAFQAAEGAAEKVASKDYYVIFPPGMSREEVADYLVAGGWPFTEEDLAIFGYSQERECLIAVHKPGEGDLGMKVCAIEKATHSLFTTIVEALEQFNQAVPNNEQRTHPSGARDIAHKAVDEARKRKGYAEPWGWPGAIGFEGTARHPVGPLGEGAR